MAKKLISDATLTKLDIARETIMYHVWLDRGTDKWEVSMRDRETKSIIVFLDGVYDTAADANQAILTLQSAMDCLQYV